MNYFNSHNPTMKLVLAQWVREETKAQKMTQSHTAVTPQFQDLGWRSFASNTHVPNH